MAATEKKERIDGYLKRLQLLKERGALREVVEREMLYECILANKDRINEYPLLEPQQRSILHFLCHRTQEHPCRDHVGGLLNGFVSRLTEFSKIADGAESEAGVLAMNELANTETVLLKLVQGVVYATALAVDNFGEVIIKFFGAEAMERMDEILKSVELSEKFWGDHVDHFVVSLVKDAYRDIVTNNRYTLVKRNNGLVLAVNFDDVLGSLKQTSKAIEKTRVQSYFEKDASSEEAVKIQDAVTDYLRQRGGKVLRPSLVSGDLDFMARFVSVDQAGRDYLAALQPGEEGEESQEHKDKQKDDQKAEQHRQFVGDQVFALAVGADLASFLMAEDMARAVSRFQHKEVEAIRTMVRNFEIRALEGTLSFMLQCELASVLRGFGEEEGNKILVRVSQIRRVDQASVQALFDTGLNRIRKNKIWEPDPGDESMLLFRPRTGKDLKELLAMLQIEPELAKAIAGLWDCCGRKVELLVLFNIQLIAKTTTNLKTRMAKILAAYGIGGSA